ncbi:thioesterase II family protein [Jatrophihabitans sp.]|jgi:surfactin synthase thioesterase subunit|uniref:thioesterase II family protein n=1 Tax=Jatrophihabitans sp. TaxID=1932789 RepID=UPI002EFCBB6D
MTYGRDGRLGLRTWHGDGGNIVCFPCAGGDSLSFRSFAAALPDWYQVTALDLPGHGGAPGFPVTSLDRLVQLSTAALVRRPVPVAVLGHSFGAYLAVESVRRLGALDSRWRDVRVILCSARAPAVATTLPSPALADDALAAELVGLGGIPQELVGSPLMAQFLPRIRADLTAARSYVADARRQHRPPLDNRTLVITGAADPLCDPRLAGAWREVVTNPDAVVIQAGHYVPQTAPAVLAQTVDGWLSTTDALPDAHVFLGA